MTMDDIPMELFLNPRGLADHERIPSGDLAACFITHISSLNHEAFRSVQEMRAARELIRGVGFQPTLVQFGLPGEYAHLQLCWKKPDWKKYIWIEFSASWEDDDETDVTFTPRHGQQESPISVKKAIILVKKALQGVGWTA